MEEPKNIFELLGTEKNRGASDDAIYRSVRGFLEKKARENGIPYHGHFELTPLCNLDCKMCYVHLHESQMNGQELLPSKTWINLMDQAIDAGMIKASLSGGECLTYPQFDEIYLFLKSRYIDINVLTNGLLLNHERIEFFKQYLPSLIQISLYGYSEESYLNVTGHQVFSTVLKNIQIAKEADLPVKLAITPSKYMGKAVKDVIQLAKNLEIPYTINLGLMTPRDDTGRKDFTHDLSLEEYMDVFKYNRLLHDRLPEPQKVLPLYTGKEREYENKGLKCGAGRSAFTVCWNGIMTPCALLNSVKADPVQDGFKVAWEYINKVANCFPRFVKCDNCTYSKACIFCAAENEKRGSRYYLSPVWCERTWKMVENGLRRVDLLCE